MDNIGKVTIFKRPNDKILGALNKGFIDPPFLQ